MVNICAISLSENIHRNNERALSQFRKNISSSAVLNSNIAPPADTFPSKKGTIKTFFWEDKVVDEDHADVSKYL